MAYSRMIRQNFFNEPKLSKYTPLQRYLLIGLVCNTDDFGRLWYNDKLIKSAVFPLDDEIENEWINETIEKLIKDKILCIYEEDEEIYIHFPKWFDKGWYLKQRLDHPREFVYPDCPICRTEEYSTSIREISRTIKEKIKEEKENKEKTDLYRLFLNKSYLQMLEDKYDFITYFDKFEECLNYYVKTVEESGDWDANHRLIFELQVSAFNDKLEKDFMQ